MEPDEEIRRKLDEVVGDRYDERGRPGIARWLARSLPKWIAGVLLAAGAAAVVFEVLDRHIIAAHQRKPGGPPRPVTVEILPAKPP